MYLKKLPIALAKWIYNCHFIIKELGGKSFKKITCLGENTEKYITFTVPIEKEVKRIDKNGQ